LFPFSLLSIWVTFDNLKDFKRNENNFFIIMKSNITRRIKHVNGLRILIWRYKRFPREFVSFILRVTSLVRHNYVTVVTNRLSSHSTPRCDANTSIKQGLKYIWFQRTHFSIYLLPLTDFHTKRTCKVCSAKNPTHICNSGYTKYFKAMV
jgi:hypothetical protein